jgi:putative transposase
MLKAYKYCLLPTEEQKQQLNVFFGCARFVYNLGLETKIAAYKMRGKSLSFFDLRKQAVELKNTEAEWLSECPAQALEASIANMDNAFQSFFRGGGFPRFKSKRDKQAIQVRQSIKADFANNKIHLPKLKWVDCILHRSFSGKIKQATISKTPTGKYFVSVLVDTGVEKPVKRPVLKETSVGIDLGIKDFAITSDGEIYENHKFLGKNLRRLRVEQRSLQRKKKGSNSYEKQKLVIARLHEKIANQRKDYMHKVSAAIIKQYDTICMETLNTAGMMQNRRLSRAISEMGWAEFNTMLEYKADWYGKNILRIGRFEPSSRVCHVCGWHNKDLKLSDRTWTCANGHILDRDLNSAQNIRNFSFRAEALLANAVH